MATATIQVETRKSCKTPPDFTFPPKYNHSPTISGVTTGPTQRSPPDFGFPAHPVARNPSPRPAELPKSVKLPPLDASILPQASKGPTLLTIPLEIRLQIYNYVLLSHPIHHAHLAPTNNDASKKEEFHTSMLRPQGRSFPTSSPLHILTSTTSPSSSPENDASTTSRIRINRPARIQGKIPTALLSCSRQIYFETHLLPFQASHFAFVNWFWSGVYAARQFSRSLRPWQSSSLRFVSVEVLGRDLWVGGMARFGGGIGGGATSTQGYGGNGGKGVGEFRELCGLWTGVWGLRLGVKGSVVLNGRIADVQQVGWNGEGGKWSAAPSSHAETSLEQKKNKERGILNVQMEWVIDGLLRMKALRWIELEIEDEDVDRDNKFAFCRELGDVLTELRNRDDGWMGDVRVTFVEQIAEVDTEGEEEQFVGEPGDEQVWTGGL